MHILFIIYIYRFIIEMCFILNFKKINDLMRNKNNKNKK